MSTQIALELALGPYAVGFRTAFATDYSRRYGAQLGRPIFVATWYPAFPSDGATALCYGDYLSVTAENEAYAAFAERLTAYNREATVQYGLEQDTSLLAQREQLPTRAFRDAEPVVGSFPVVSYHPGLGGSYEDNSLLCEYLASFGYIVVSSTFQPEEASSLNLDWDLTRSFADLGFLINATATQPNTDIQRIGIAGQSFGGQAAMAYSFTKNCPASAIVSLDSTVEYTALDEPRREGFRKALAPVENVQAPWLLFAVKENNPNWSWWDALTAIPCWFAATEPLQHNDFTSQGMLGTTERHPNPEEAARIRLRYNAICELTRRFFDHTLKGELSPQMPDESPLEVIYRAPPCPQTRTIDTTTLLTTVAPVQ